MSIQDTVRDLQDNLRNAGWRIEWIPWQQPGRPEYVYNTPLTKATGLGGVAMFLGSLAYLGFAMYRASQQGDIPKHLLPVTVGIAFTGIAIAIAGRVYAAKSKQSGWECVQARCTDREIKTSRTTGAKGRTCYEYRLLCTFNYNGSEYTVTPESSHIVAFTNKEKLEKYLDENISPEGTCNLWIDPHNPLHAVFDKKQRI